MKPSVLALLLVNLLSPGGVLAAEAHAPPALTQRTWGQSEPTDQDDNNEAEEPGEGDNQDEPESDQEQGSKSEDSPKQPDEQGSEGQPSPVKQPTEDELYKLSPIPPLSVYEELVVTATGEERVLSDSPIPVLLLREQDLREHGANNLGEALRRAPGLALDVHNYGDQFGGSGLSLSGAEARHTLVLIDGRPVAGDSNGVVDISQIPAELVERVEIVEGPMSALYGSDAIGGVLNIITRSANAGSAIGGSSRYGSHHQQSHALSASHGNDLIGASLNLNYQYFDGLEDQNWLNWPGGDSGPYSRYLMPPAHQLGVQGNFALHAGRFRLKLSSLLNHHRRQGESAELYPEPVGTLQYSDPRQQTRWVSNAHFALQLSKTRFVDLDLGGTLFQSSSAHRQQQGPDFRQRQGRDGLFQLRLRAALDIESSLLLQGGLELYRQDLEVTSERYSGEDQAPETIIELPDKAVHRVEPYLHLDWFARPWLEVLAGFRTTIHETFGVQPIPSISLNFKPWRFTRLRISAGRGYRAPDLKELFYEFDHSHLGYLVLGNDELQAESSWGANLSLEQRRLGGVLTLRIGGFVNYFTELIELRLNPAASQAGLVVYRYDNLGRALTAGAQLFMLLDLPYLEASGSWRYLFSRDLERGGHLVSRPEHSGSLSLMGKIPQARLRLGAQLSGKSSYLSEVPNLEGTGLVSELETVDSPPIVMLGLLISWRPIAALEIHANLSNLLDQRRDPGDFDRLESPLGRTFTVGVRLRFDKAQGRNRPPPKENNDAETPGAEPLLH